MKIDLHIHSNNSDGRWAPEEIFKEAQRKKIGFISITDHDSIQGQESSRMLSDAYSIQYIFGLELNVSFSHPRYRDSKPISLDFLGYDFDITFQPLVKKLINLRDFRNQRAEKILEKINHELHEEGLSILTHEDLEEIQSTVDGSFGRPHIANYMVKKGLVSSKQEAFDKYLTKCNVPKMPLSISEASELIRGAGGKLILAHPSDPNGTSLATLTPSLDEQQKIIKDVMLPYIDGIECWHSRHDRDTSNFYLSFVKNLGLIATGGSDCHQQPVLMGTVDTPIFVSEQFAPTLQKI